MAEAESVSARKATLLNPTEDDETVQVLRRRLFERIDEAAAAQVIEVTSELSRALAPATGRPSRPTLDKPQKRLPISGTAIRSTPTCWRPLRGKTATLANFQRVRGMLRILGRTVSRLWADPSRPTPPRSICTISTPAIEPIRQEIVTRLGQSMYVPAIRNDIAGEQGKRLWRKNSMTNTYRGCRLTRPMLRGRCSCTRLPSTTSSRA